MSASDLKPTQNSEELSVEQNGTELRRVLQKLPEADRKKAIALCQQITFQGPLPPPAMMAQYDQLIPDGADRLMKLVESEVKHRHTQEDRVVKTQTALPIRGQNIAAGLTILLIGAGTYLTQQGHSTVGMAIFGSTIAAVAAVFVYARRHEGHSISAATSRSKGKRTR